jgi:hypothetical protein
VVPIRATQLNIPEDTILHSHHCENLKSYKAKRNAINAHQVLTGQTKCLHIILETELQFTGRGTCISNDDAEHKPILEIF